MWSEKRRDFFEMQKMQKQESEMEEKRACEIEWARFKSP